MRSSYANILAVIVHRKHVHGTIYPVHLVFIKVHHLLIVNKIMRATIHVSSFRIMLRYLWQHATLSHMTFPNINWLYILFWPLSRYWLILSSVINHVLLNFLLCQLNLIFYVIMPFINICYFLKPFKLLFIFSAIICFQWLSSKVPVNDM